MKSLTRYSVGFVSLVAVAGCSSSSPSSSPNTAAITGSVRNISMRARSAIARNGTVATSTLNGTTTHVRGLRVLISDRANTCGAFHAQNSTNLIITIPDDNFAPGTYPIANTASTTATAEESEVDFNAVDQGCNDKVAEPATTGTVTLENVVFNLIGPGDSIVSGTVDATFAGGHLTGDFAAVLCPDASDVDASSTEADAESSSASECTP